MKHGITLPDEAGNYMFRMQIWNPFNLLGYVVNSNTMQRDYQNSGPKM